MPENQQYTQRATGKPTVPAMDYESERITTLGNFVLGSGSAGTLHVLTFNKAGTTWIVDIHKILFNGTTSAGVASIDPATQGTFGYNIHFSKGLIINSKSGTPGDLTVVFRVG